MPDAKLVAAGSVALTVTLIAIFSLRPLAPRVGLVDRPDERKRHDGHVPLIGGLCFFAGMVAGLSYLGILDRFVMSLLMAGSAILLTGLLDDMYDLRVGPRLGIQVGAAAAVIAITGVHVDSLGYLGDTELRVHALGIPLTIFAVVGLINAFNMVDGIDGLAASLAMVCILAVLTFATGAGWQGLGVLLLLQILLVAMLPYLSVNLGWPDGRKIFMGDAGSTVVGFLLAWSLVFLSQREVAQLAPVDVLWCVALPIMDTLAVMVRRVSQGRSPFKADRQHLHHLVLDAGFSPRIALVLIVAAATLLAGLGYALREVPDLLNLAIFVTVLAAYVTRLPRILNRVAGVVRRTPAAEQAVAAAFGKGTVISFDDTQPVALQDVRTDQKPLKALCVLGDSPDAVKVALVAQRLLHDRRFDTRICVTDLVSETQRKVLDLFDIRPDIRLDISHCQTDPTDIASATLNAMKRVLAQTQPDLVLVHGDTSATLAATLAACYQQIPVARLESSPYTESAQMLSSGEQINRRLASALASLHLTPSESAGRQLVAAGIPRDRITVTGDPAIETMRAAVERINEDASLQVDMARRFSFLRPGSPLLLVTHREQIASFAQLGRALRKVARMRPEVDIVYPIAMTPDAQKNTQLLGWRPANVHLIEPLDYLAFAYLLKSAYLVLTGSGEVENEAAMLGKPVLVLRDAIPHEQEDRRLNTVAADDSAIANGVMTLLNDPAIYDAMRVANRGASGSDACFRIVDALAAVPARSSALAA